MPLPLEQQILDSFTATVQPTQIDCPIRILGPFSSGKSSLVQVLLQGLVPEALLPISSNQPETSLPLHIVHGETVELKLHKIAAEKDITLTEFPNREQTQALKPDYKSDYLSLTVNKEELITDSDLFGDFEGPITVSLVDTPGWDADDESHISRNRVGIKEEKSPGMILVLRKESVENRHFYEQFDILIRNIFEQLEYELENRHTKFTIIPIINDTEIFQSPHANKRYFEDKLYTKLSDKINAFYEEECLETENKHFLQLHNVLYWDLKGSNTQQYAQELWTIISKLFRRSKDFQLGPSTIPPEKMFSSFPISQFQQELRWLRDFRRFVELTQKKDLLKGLSALFLNGLNRSEQIESIWQAVETSTGSFEFKGLVDSLLTTATHQPLVDSSHPLSDVFDQNWTTHLNMAQRSLQKWYETLESMVAHLTGQKSLSQVWMKLNNPIYTDIFNVYNTLYPIPIEEFVQLCSEHDATQRVPINLLASWIVIERLDALQPT